MQTINERIIHQRKPVALVIILGILVIDIAVIISLVGNFNLVQNLIMGWVFSMVYSILMFLFFGGQTVLERNVDNYSEVEKKVVQFVPGEKELEIFPVDNPTVKIVEKPVVRKVYIEVPKEKIVYKEKPREKLNIPKYKYFGSKETKTYHLRTCRFRKLIKKKHQLSSNSEAFFKKLKFKKCKLCFGK